MEIQTTIIILAVIVACTTFGLWLYLRKRQSSLLRAHFGFEYDQAVAPSGKQACAEAGLEARTERSKQVNIARHSPEEKTCFSEA